MSGIPTSRIDPFNSPAQRRPAAGTPGVPQAATPPLPGVMDSPSGDLFIEADLTGVESGGLTDPGDYCFVLTKIEPGKTASGDSKYIFNLRLILHDRFEGRRFYIHCSTAEVALWKLKQTLEAFAIPTNGQVRQKASDLIDWVCVGTVSEGGYTNNDGKFVKRSELNELRPWPVEHGGPGSKFINGQVIPRIPSEQSTS